MMVPFPEKDNSVERMSQGKRRIHNSLLVIMHVNYPLYIKDAQLRQILFIQIYVVQGRNQSWRYHLCAVLSSDICLLNQHLYT